MRPTGGAQRSNREKTLRPERGTGHGMVLNIGDLGRLDNLCVV